MNRAQMVAPFAEEELRQFKGRGGKTMTFIEDETVMDRLDAGYGFGNWQLEVHPVPFAEGVVKVRLGVRESGEWLWYEDFGYPNQPDGDVLKEAVSDGIRRCGRYVGIARDLYRKSTYEPGGALGPTRSEPNLRVGAADHEAPASPDMGGAVEELLGVETAQGNVKLGSSEAYKLEARETPEGMAFGFRLEMAGDKALPQVVVVGEAAIAALLATQNDPKALLGQWVRVKGKLYSVRAPGRRSFNRLKATEIATREWSFPTETTPAPKGGPGEPPQAGAEATTGVAESAPDEAQALPVPPEAAGALSPEPAALSPGSAPDDQCDSASPYGDNLQCELLAGHKGPHKVLSLAFPETWTDR